MNSRRDFLKYATVGTGLAGAWNLQSCLGDEPERNWLRGIDEYVEAAMKRWKLPALAIGVVRGGVVVHCRGYGVRAVGSGDKVDHESMFPLASCTKSFTAAAIARLVDAGKVHWDHPIVKHLPTFQLSSPELTASLTIRHALSHRSGLPTANMLWRRGDFSSDEIFRKLRHLQPVAAPGERFIYNNNMYLVLGKLIEQVSGQSWWAFVRDAFIRPLGMTTTISDLAVLPKIKNLAIPHICVDDTNGESVDGEVRRIERHVPLAVAPAGAIHSNVRDMTRWLKFQLGDGTYAGQQILSQGRVAEMHSALEHGPDPSSADSGQPRAPVTHYGLGWFFNVFAGQQIIEHSGTQNGFVTSVAMMPSRHLGVVVFGNCHRTGLVPAMKFWIFDAVLARAQRDWSEVVRSDYANNSQRLIREAKAKFESQRDRTTRPSVSLAKYVGGYRSALYGSLRISIEKDQLRLRCGTRFVGHLEHWQGNSFRVTFPNPNLIDWMVTFSVNDGEVRSLLAEDAPWAPAWFDDRDELGEFFRL